MAGQALSVQFDPEDEKKLRKFFDAVADGIADMTPFFDAVEMHMIDSLTMNFEDEGRPESWEPLAASTIEMKGSDAILQDTGDLKNSINASNTERDKFSLKIWAGSEHGKYHQDPDKNPMDQFDMVNDRGMPMRPFMLFQDEDVKEIEEILIRYVDSIGGF
jgi:phage gpG-like protein